MATIIPAILPKNYEDLKNKISMVRGLAPIVQIDICDGVFVKTVTWPFLSKGDEDSFLENSFDEHFRRILNEQEGLPFWEDIDFELDLMVSNAVRNFDVYTKLGARRIIFHLEAMGEVEEFRDFIEGIDAYVRDVMEIGVAIGVNTKIEEIFPLLGIIDFVQVMGIDHEGIQGEKFDEKCLEHIKNIKEKSPHTLISVDGGVNFETAPKIISAGADRLVIGSAIFKTNNILETLEQFQSL